MGKKLNSTAGETRALRSWFSLTERPTWPVKPIDQCSAMEYATKGLKNQVVRMSLNVPALNSRRRRRWLKNVLKLSFHVGDTREALKPPLNWLGRARLLAVSVEVSVDPEDPEIPRVVDLFL